MTSLLLGIAIVVPREQPQPTFPFLRSECFSMFCNALWLCSYDFDLSQRIVCEASTAGASGTAAIWAGEIDTAEGTIPLAASNTSVLLPLPSTSSTVVLTVVSDALLTGMSKISIAASTSADLSRFTINFATATISKPASAFVKKGGKICLGQSNS